ncbi:hypothetical protein KHA80_06630 [Anaerobacillus sp. HL2]|nr:hypothetical protein KHA80_06630 [Anaerobacillus sp. HL2]
MAQDLVEKINSSMYGTTSHSSINLQTIQQRLNERYKNRASLQIESVENEGTIVTIFIPCTRQMSLI